MEKRGLIIEISDIPEHTCSYKRQSGHIEFYHRKVDGGTPKMKALIAASRKQCPGLYHTNGDEQEMYGKPLESLKSYKTTLFPIRGAKYFSLIHI